jgi:hypothetical protein
VGDCWNGLDSRRLEGKRLNGVTRRSALAVVGILALTGPGRLFRRHEAASTTELARGVAALLPDSAARLGRHYLEAHPAEADIANLLDLLGVKPAATRRSALRRVIAARRVDDLVAGRMVRVDGWVMARTEARACAIAALI